MEWLKGKLGQVIAVAALVSTIAGFGYTGAGYVTRLEAVEKRSGISYKKELQALTDTDVAIEKEIFRIIALNSFLFILKYKNKFSVL